LDHKEIFDKALETLRMELNLMPVGYNLLTENSLFQSCNVCMKLFWIEN
jgi:hypothetical protein